MTLPRRQDLPRVVFGVCRLTIFALLFAAVMVTAPLVPGLKRRRRVVSAFARAGLRTLGLDVGIDGWQLADQVRGRWPATPFVLVTGWAAGLDSNDARRAGVDAILPKPFAFADLRRIVTTLISSPAR